MKKPDGLIKFLAILTIFSGLLSVFEAFSIRLLEQSGIFSEIALPKNVDHLLTLALGVTVVVIGIGIWKLRKWALYGIALLIGYDIISTIIFLFNNRIDTVALTLVGFLLFRIFIYSYLWEKRALFEQ